MGRAESKIVEQAVQDNMPIPDRILNAPELADGNDLFLDGFYELDTCRQIGLAKGQIPFLAIVQYCAFYNFDDDLAEEFSLVIRSVDNLILNYEAEQAEKKKAQGGQNGKRS